MTTIAWDGHTLAADRRVNSNGLIRTTTKIRRMRDGRLCGVSGHADAGMAALDWLEDTSLPRPAWMADKDEFCNVIEIDNYGYVWLYERFGRFRGEDRFTAIGSGRDFAISAMHFGKNAAEAVRFASFYDIWTGDGVDTLTLESACGAAVD